MFTSRTKKLSIIAGTVASAVIFSTFSGLAMGSDTKFLSGQTIGTSTETSSSSEQNTESFISTYFKDLGVVNIKPVNQKTVEYPKPTVMNLTTPEKCSFGEKDLVNEKTVEDPKPTVLNLNPPEKCRFGGAEKGIYNKDLVNEKTVEDPKPTVINLTTPGNYRLVGAEKGIYNNQDPNEIIVNTNDRICIGDIEDHLGDIGNPYKKYNIILDNVNIDINGGKSSPISPVTIGKDIDVSFTLMGKNSLNCEHNLSQSALNANFTSTKLTIDGLGEDASLDIHSDHGILASNVTINGGTINATGDHGILASNVTINGGTINAIGEYGIEADNGLTINGGIINAIGKCIIYVDNGLTINGGKVNANRIYLQGNVIMNGGELIIDSIHSIAQGKDINFNHNMSKFFNESTELYATYDKSTNMYGIYDNEGKRVWIKNAGHYYNNNKIIVYHLSWDIESSKSINFDITDSIVYNLAWDIGSSKSKSINFEINDNGIVYNLAWDIRSSKSINFYITGGIINGIIDFTPDTSINEIPFSSQFPTPGSGNKFCDFVILNSSSNKK